MKKIGVISDTHNVYNAKIDELFDGVDLIFHAGEICKESILDPLRGMAPLVAVLGNNDMLPGYREVEARECNGVTFLMTHIRPPRPPAGCDWLIFGHTHVPYDKVEHGTRFFNPGTAGKANKGAPSSVAVLDWRDGAWHPTLHLI